jgi:hypothetical protein
MTPAVSSPFLPKEKATMSENATDSNEDGLPPVLDDTVTSLAAFHSAEAEIMMLKYGNVESLIGKCTHHESEGTYCEDLVREFLRKVLPQRFSVDSGFIRGKEVEIARAKRCVSHQLDLIVHDTTDCSPIFRSEDFVVVLPEAVAGVIEVKKCLRPRDLASALWNLAVARYLTHHSRPKHLARVFTSVFGFTSDKMCPKSKPFSATYANRLAEIGQKIAPMYSVPDMITVVDREILHRGPTENLETPFGVKHRRSTLDDGKVKANVACQALLCSLLFEMRVKEVSGDVWHRFSFPSGFTFKEVMSFWKPQDLLPPKDGDPREEYCTRY